MTVYVITDKDGNDNTIVADETFVKEAYPSSDGWSYKLYVEPEKSDEMKEGEKKMEARVWRDQELAETDNIAQTPDFPNRDKYLTYRQALRDWPSTADFPDKKPTLGS
jgi:hypothetical protein|tara:strand:- start:99 stop:422 length:324 start_codon:yes stop_codon:yes gene_type:complete